MVLQSWEAVSPEFKTLPHLPNKTVIFNFHVVHFFQSTVLKLIEISFSISLRWHQYSQTNRLLILRLFSSEVIRASNEFYEEFRWGLISVTCPACCWGFSEHCLLASSTRCHEMCCVWEMCWEVMQWLLTDSASCPNHLPWGWEDYPTLQRGAEVQRIFIGHYS